MMRLGNHTDASSSQQNAVLRAILGSSANGTLIEIYQVVHS
jgi:hypothetical protein